MCKFSISRTEGKNILENQTKILNNLNIVLYEFGRVDNLFCSCQTMLNSIKPRLKDVKKILDLIESSINNITVDIQEKLNVIVSKADDISKKLIAIKIINVTLTEITDKVESINKKVNTTTLNPKYIIQKLKDIICKLDSIETTIDCFVSAQKDIVPALNKVECSLNNIGKIDIKGNLIHMKSNFSYGTMVITIVLIIIIAILTALPFLLKPEQMVIVYGNKCYTYVPLGSILITLSLAGIWVLAFVYIKSRIKIDEQDNMAFRKSLDDC